MYDYVVVGGGSTGCVLAARLSEDPKVRVLLLEEGPADTSPYIHIPGAYYKTAQGPLLKRIPWVHQHGVEKEGTAPDRAQQNDQQPIA